MAAEQKSAQERMLATIKKHERLIELAKKTNNLGKITEQIFTQLSDLVTLNEKVLICYYQLQVGEVPVQGGGSKQQLFSCELHLLTTSKFLKLGFYPTSHTYNVRKVDHIGELNVQKIFGSQYDIDSEIGAEENSFKPSQLKFSMTFNDANGDKVTSWDIDTMEENNISLLLEQIKEISQHIGVPLAKLQ